MLKINLFLCCSCLGYCLRCFFFVPLGIKGRRQLTNRITQPRDLIRIIFENFAKIRRFKKNWICKIPGCNTEGLELIILIIGIFRGKFWLRRAKFWFFEEISGFKIKNCIFRFGKSEFGFTHWIMRILKSYRSKFFISMRVILLNFCC